MSDDLSDEAFWEREQTLDWKRYEADQSFAWHALEGWRECRRRAEALIEAERRKAFWWSAIHVMNRAGYDINEKGLDEQIEKAYRAYTAAAKE